MDELPCSEASIQSALDLYYSMVVRISFHYLRSIHDAEDVAQDVFIKLITGVPTFLSEENRKAWIIRITINCCKDMLKSGRYTKNLPLEEAMEMTYEGGEEKYDVLDSVMRLPENLRNAIYLYYYEEMSIQDIAVALNVKPSTVGSWLYKAKKRLEKIHGR